MLKSKVVIVSGLTVFVLFFIFIAANFIWENNEVTPQSVTENLQDFDEIAAESHSQKEQILIKSDEESTTPGKEDNKRVAVPPRNIMTFRVEVPKNTPKEDVIGISLYGGKLLQMKKVTDYAYEVEVSPDQIAFVTSEASDQTIWYAYTRNQFQDTGAPYSSEFIPGTPNTNDYFWTRRGRTTVFNAGSVQKDVIFRWKWFPKEGWPAENISDLNPDRAFKPRLNNIRFRSGQGLMDEYFQWMDHLFTPTAQHLRENNYEWIVFFPSWDWQSSDPPTVRHLKTDKQTGEILGFPDDKIVKQIRDFQKEGLRVILAPQICCTPINRDGRSMQWWDTYWSEVKKVYMHYAKIAEKEDVAALVADFASIGNTQGMGETISQTEQKAWSNIWTSIADVYFGKRGQMVWFFDRNMGGLSPDPTFITWADKLNFFYVQSVGGISQSPNPTKEDLYKGAKEVLQEIKALYEVHKKPIMVQSQFSSEARAWKGEFSDEKREPGFCDDDSSDEGCEEIFSGKDQARSVNAFWQVVAEEPWIIGYTSFGYRPLEIPLKSEWSVRGKPADQVWRRWNNLIYR